MPRLNMPDVNRNYEVPFLAGYSKDGKTVYIDKRLPPQFTTKSGKVIDVCKYLVVHEVTEKHLEDTKGYKYQYAHEIATGVERKAVEADGIDWDEYENYMLKMVKKLEDFSGPIPPDLDIKPEKDSHSGKTIAKIRRLQNSQK